MTLTNRAQIQSLAQSTDVTPMRLFRPFWRSIAITVVKDLQNRPQVAQQLSDLLGTTVSEFLVWTATHTLPYLILMRRHDTLRRIAQAHEGDASVWSICVEPVNMAAILAFLLVQPSTDPERMITTLLGETSTEFKEWNLADLVRMEPILTAFELLKAAGEDDEGRKPKVGVAVGIVASHMLNACKRYTKQLCFLQQMPFEKVDLRKDPHAKAWSAPSSRPTCLVLWTRSPVSSTTYE